MDPSILIVVLVFMATVGATFSGFKTVNLIVKGDTWQLWAILTGVLIFVAALGFLLPFMLSTSKLQTLFRRREALPALYIIV